LATLEEYLRQRPDTDMVWAFASGGRINREIVGGEMVRDFVSGLLKIIQAKIILECT